MAWCSAPGGMKRATKHRPFSMGGFSSCSPDLSPCAFCLHVICLSCPDLWCRCLTSGFRASGARSGVGSLSSCFSTTARSVVLSLGFSVQGVFAANSLAHSSVVGPVPLFGLGSGWFCFDLTRSREGFLLAETISHHRLCTAGAVASQSHGGL
jgi:hypothetical protein